MMRAAVIQLCSTPDQGENLLEAGKWMLAAVRQGATLLVLPETFSLMGYTDDLASHPPGQQQRHHREDPECGPTLRFLQDFAIRHRVWIVGGSTLLAVPNNTTKVTNTCFMVDAKGHVRGRYDKIHLFDANLGGEKPYQESKLVQAGNAAVLVNTPFGKIGLTLCYDLRFPELFQVLSAQGATIITVPAAFTFATGHAHWELLLRARAVENFSYVLAAGQGGWHRNGRHTFGHSMIVEPWGNVIAQCPDGPGFALAELQPDRVERCRKRMPCLNHRVGAFRLG